MSRDFGVFKRRLLRAAHTMIWPRSAWDGCQTWLTSTPVSCGNPGLAPWPTWWAASASNPQPEDPQNRISKHGDDTNWSHQRLNKLIGRNTTHILRSLFSPVITRHRSLRLSYQSYKLLPKNNRTCILRGPYKSLTRNTLSIQNKNDNVIINKILVWDNSSVRSTVLM